MRETLEDVLVVGGGDVGLLTALSLRQFLPRLEITVVDDFSSEIPQVEQYYESVRRQVAGQHLTVREFYEGVLQGN